MDEKTTNKKETITPTLNIKQLRKEYYKIRKFEIQNLWQRSIFLATFTVILFTGYGYLVDSLTISHESNVAQDEFRIMLTHIICCSLSFLGSTFSIIWIMMAKGSKAWYEIYEKKIYNIEHNHLNWNDMYCLSGGSPKTLNNSLWSNQAGAFSVSKINILLGQTLRITWIITFNIHALCILYLDLASKSPHTSTIHLIEISALIMFIAQFPLAYFLKKWVKSDSIEDPNAPQKTNNRPPCLCASSSNAPAPQPSTSTE